MQRRQFLNRAGLISLAPFPAAFGSLCASEAQTDGRILVVIQLSGGNDGLNTIVPYSDELYAKHRQELRLLSDRLHKIDDQVALHPSMREAAEMLEEGRLAIVQGVGYPHPNRSHDVSMAIWHSASLDRLKHSGYGWLGQAMDEYEEDLGGAPHMVLLGDENPPLAIRGRKSTTVAMEHLHDLTLTMPIATSSTPTVGSKDSLLDFATATNSTAVQTAQLIQRITEGDGTTASYPATQLATRLQSIASLIKSGFATPIYYAIQSGYDTHSAQLPTHARLLRELSSGMKAFHDDLDSAGLGDRVVTLCFSEFGRRVQENASMGTDHGAAGPIFLAGKAVLSGVLGIQPSLQDLDEGDLRMQVDFRNIYASIVQDWLGVESKSKLIDENGHFKIFS